MQEMVRDMEKNVMDGMRDYFAYIIELMQQVPAMRQHCGKTGLLLRPLPRRNTKDASIQADSVVKDGLGDCYRPPTPPTDIDHATHTPPTVESAPISEAVIYIPTTAPVHSHPSVELAPVAEATTYIPTTAPVLPLRPSNSCLSPKLPPTFPRPHPSIDIRP